MSKDKEISATKHDSNESIKTSATLRAKGKAISRLCINIIKIFRMCKEARKNKEIHEKALNRSSLNAFRSCRIHKKA